MTKEKITHSQRIINKGFNKLVDILEKYQWDVTQDKACMLFSLIYYPIAKIKFAPLPQEQELEAGDYIVNGDIFSNEDITLYLSKNVPKYLTNWRKRGKWYKDFADLNKNFMLQEMHDMLEFFFGVRKKIPMIRNLLPGVTSQGYRDYLSQENELETWADGAAEEFKEFGASKIVGLYQTLFEEEHPIRKEFMDLVSKYLQMDKSQIKGVL